MPQYPDGFTPDNTPAGFIPNTPAPAAAPSGFTPDKQTNYETLVRAKAAELGLDPTIASELAHFESGFNPNAVSSAGAVGVMQVMPFKDRGDVRDPVRNIDVGLKIWKDALKQAGGDPDKAYRLYYNPGYKGLGPWGNKPKAAPRPVPTSQSLPGGFVPGPVPKTGTLPAQVPSHPPTPSGTSIGSLADKFLKKYIDPAAGWTEKHFAEPARLAGRILRYPITGPFEKDKLLNPDLTPTSEYQRGLDVITNVAGPMAMPLVGGNAAALAENIGRRGGQAVQALGQRAGIGRPPVPTPEVPLVPGAPPTAPKTPLTTPPKLGISAHENPNIPPGGVPGPRTGLTPPTPTPRAPEGSWKAVVQQAKQADQGGHALFSKMDAFDGETLRALKSSKMLPANERALTDLLHSPNSPLVTGAWPEWVAPEVRQILVSDMRRLQQLRVEVENVPKELRALVTGGKELEAAVTPEGLPYFPRVNIQEALESKSVAGYRGFRSGGPRRFFQMDTPTGPQLVVVKGGNAFVKDDLGNLTKIGTTESKPGSPILSKGQQLGILKTAEPEVLRAAGEESEILNNPVAALRQRLKQYEWIKRSDEWRQDLTSGRYSDIVAKTSEEPDWVRAPYLGPDISVHPLLAKAVERVKSMREGSAHWNLLNNFYVGTMFRVMPWGHHPNIGLNWAVAQPMDQLKLMLKGQFQQTMHEAATEVETFGPKYIRMLELGGGRQHVNAQMQKAVEQILSEVSKDPAAQKGFLGKFWKSWGDYSHAVPWGIDAKARMQLVLTLEKNGVPFEDAVKLINIKLPNYWLPSFYAAPTEKMQPLFNALHSGYTNPAFLFSPYHGTLASGAYQMLTGRLGMQGVQTVVATYLAMELADKVLAPHVAKLTADYWRQKATKATNPHDKRQYEMQAQRWERMHISVPGYGTLGEGIKGSVGLAGSALQSPNPYLALKKIGLPAAVSAVNPILTPGPLAIAGQAALDLHQGQLPQGYGMGVPGAIGTFLQAPGTIPEKFAATVMAAGRMYPRYYLPSEKIAHDYAKQLQDTSSGVRRVLFNARTPQESTQMIQKMHTTLYTLNLMAARDLAKEGLLHTSPENYAKQLTDAIMQQVKLEKKPSIHPSRPKPTKTSPFIPRPVRP